MRGTVACALVVTLLLPSPSRSDDAGQVSKAILASVAERLPPGAAPLTQSELREVMVMIQSIQVASYYPIDVRAAKAAISKSIADAASASNATAPLLARAGISATLDSIGHGAQLYPVPAEKNKAAEQPAAPWISARQVGSLRLISMPRLDVKPETLCSELRNEPTTEDYDSIVLDLRGNAGGVLKAVPNVASHFLDPDQPLFRVRMKDGTADEFVSLRCGPAPLKLPLAVLVDEKTDSGGLLLAAVLQDHRRAILIGRTKTAVNGSTYYVFMSRTGALTAKVPVGELVLSGNRPLADGVRVDVTVPPQDEAAMLEAARTSFGAR